MRGRCERHQLALGPRGCLLCRREADAAATATAPVAEPAAPPRPEPEVAGAESDGTPDMATGVSKSTPYRRAGIRLGPSTLLAPLVVAGMYLIVRDAAHSQVRPSAESTRAPASASARPAGNRPPARADAAKPAGAAKPAQRSFDVLVIEELSAPELRAMNGATPEPPPAAAAARPQISSTATARARQDAEESELATMRERVDITVYSTAWCPACRSLRSYLMDRGIRSTEYDVEHDRQAKLRQRKLNPRGSVPTVDIDGQVLVGFSAQSIEAAIDRAARARLRRL